MLSNIWTYDEKTVSDSLCSFLCYPYSSSHSHSEKDVIHKNQHTPEDRSRYAFLYQGVVEFLFFFFYYLKLFCFPRLRDLCTFRIIKKQMPSIVKYHPFPSSSNKQISIDIKIHHPERVREKVLGEFFWLYFFTDAKKEENNSTWCLCRGLHKSWLIIIVEIDRYVEKILETLDVNSI